MSENTEDLYLKGFMAFSAKRYNEAKQLWEQVLSQDPNHEKAQRGLKELHKYMPKKRTSKEILQEIKSLYAVKKYPEALKLCEVLIKKYPSNQDLVGLYRKIANRIQSTSAQASSSKEGSDFENTIYFQKKAEEFVSNVADSDNTAEDQAKQDVSSTSQQVESLIQKGVAEYEAGTLPQALASWQEALRLDPNNRIARDYIANVKSIVGTATQAPSAPKPKPARPSKEKLLEAYNQGLKFYQTKDYKMALERWNYILKFHPNHKETLQCLEKTKTALEKQEQQLERLERARKELGSGNHVAAQSILMQLSIEAPELPGLQQLKETLEERQKQINEIRSLELESEEHRESSFSPTDDEITQYFTPDEGTNSGARQVTRVIVPKKEKKPVNKLALVGVILGVAAVSVGGFFGWQTYQKRQQQVLTDTFVMPKVEINWNSDWQRAEDFNSLGTDFANEGDNLLARLAFDRANGLVVSRLGDIQQHSGEEELAYDKASEKTALEKIQTDVASELERLAPAKPASETVTDPIRKAEAAIRKDQFPEAVNLLRQALLMNPADQAARQKLGEIHEYLAFEKLKQDELHEALGSFKKALVLQAAYERPRQHVEVIQRFFNGRIAEIDKNQWFFFFMD